ncbi:MAG: type II toxin-antitoxin system Y4mF family antitoxin [Longimicrobiales bacterium]|nr:type II toxin-antitoxin system Y4mF family antitoxin [Longimicrobiales bacterium]
MVADSELGSGGSPGSGRRVAVLAEVVRGRREELGLRQSELADLAGCSPRFVHTVEHGKASLRLDKVLDVLEVLGLDLLVAPGQGLGHGPGAGPGLRARP